MSPFQGYGDHYACRPGALPRALLWPAFQAGVCRLGEVGYAAAAASVFNFEPSVFDFEPSVFGFGLGTLDLGLGSK
jgi:hypothetical protein